MEDNTSEFSNAILSLSSSSLFSFRLRPMNTKMFYQQKVTAGDLVNTPDATVPSTVRGGEAFSHDLPVGSISMYSHYEEGSFKNTPFVRLYHVSQVNYFLYNEFVDYMHQKIGKMAAAERARYQLQEDDIEVGMKMGLKWHVGGVCITPIDDGSTKTFMDRKVLTKYRGSINCENIWGKDLRTFDTCFLVLKFVRVTNGQQYNVSKLGNLQGKVLNEYSKHFYAPQFCPCIATNSCPSEYDLRFSIPHLDGASGSYPGTTRSGVPYLVGVCENNEDTYGSRFFSTNKEKKPIQPCLSVKCSSHMTMFMCALN